MHTSQWAPARPICWPNARVEWCEQYTWMSSLQATAHSNPPSAVVVNCESMTWQSTNGFAGFSVKSRPCTLQATSEVIAYSSKTENGEMISSSTYYVCRNYERANADHCRTQKNHYTFSTWGTYVRKYALGNPVFSWRNATVRPVIIQEH